jgi:dihydroorotate dehydrogenase
MQASPLPIIGAGGIFSEENARAILSAGAAAVQVDAVVWVDPGVIARMASALLEG